MREGIKSRISSTTFSEGKLHDYIDDNVCECIDLAIQMKSSSECQDLGHFLTLSCLHFLEILPRIVVVGFLFYLLCILPLIRSIYLPTFCQYGSYISSRSLYDLLKAIRSVVHRQCFSAFCCGSMSIMRFFSGIYSQQLRFQIIFGIYF
jgi:hypothetical protein